ncbi:MAG: PDZ domain-containing protein [Gammaproteobacteria bacterium]|nr:MAG: PDZ domain-containing protein [Gammaproteobacteria bacterium]
MDLWNLHPVGMWHLHDLPPYRSLGTCRAPLFCNVRLVHKSVGFPAGTAIGIFRNSRVQNSQAPVGQSPQASIPSSQRCAADGRELRVPGLVSRFEIKGEPPLSDMDKEAFMRPLKPLLLAVSLVVSTAPAIAATSPDAAATPDKPAAPETKAGGHLGVRVGMVPPPLAAQLPAEVPRGQGLMVVEVQPDSPAAQAGLQTYDVLLSYDDQRLYAPEQLARLVASDRPGREVRLRVARAGQLKEITVTLGKGAPPPVPAYPHPPRGWMPPAPQVPPQLRSAPLPRPERPAPRVQSVFESLAVERLPDGRYRAALKYKGPDGKTRSYRFEGSRESLREQIQGSQDLPPPARRQLLNAIGMADRPVFPEFGRPLNFDELMRLWRQNTWPQ